MKELSLRPYPGIVRMCKTRKEYLCAYQELFGEETSLAGKNGRVDGKWCTKSKQCVYVVWAADFPHLAHEMSHIIFDMFECVGIDPREANHEPFCYMLAQLLIEAS